MLTVAKIDTYARFDGDLDAWARSRATGAAPGMADADWYLIDELLLDLAIVAAGRASAAFRAAVDAKLRAVLADEAACAALHALAQRAR